MFNIGHNSVFFPQAFQLPALRPTAPFQGAAPAGARGAWAEVGACSSSEPSALVECVTSPARALLSQVAGAQTR